MIKNTLYKGQWYYGRTRSIKRDGRIVHVPLSEDQWVMVPVPAIIDPETWEEAQRCLAAGMSDHRRDVPIEELAVVTPFEPPPKRFDRPVTPDTFILDLVDIVGHQLMRPAVLGAAHRPGPASGACTMSAPSHIILLTFTHRPDEIPIDPLLLHEHRRPEQNATRTSTYALILGNGDPAGHPHPPPTLHHPWHTFASFIMWGYAMHDSHARRTEQLSERGLTDGVYD